MRKKAPDESTDKPSRADEFQLVAEEYANDQREIIKELRRKLRGSAGRLSSLQVATMRKADAVFCRNAAEHCRINAAASSRLSDTDDWLELASAWTKLAEAFDKEDRPRWLN